MNEREPRGRSGCVGLFAVVAAAGCYDGVPPSASGGSAATDGASTGAGPDAGGEEPPGTQELDCGEDGLGHAWLRRLTVAEYEASIEQLVGGPVELGVTFPDDPTIDGFKNDLATLTMSAAHAERYQGAAEAAAEFVTSDSSVWDATVGCDATESTCLDAFVRSFGRHAYRRPLADSEVASLVSLGTQSGDSGSARVGTVIEAVLQSPSFLFRIEVGEPLPDRPLVSKLTSFELASRLSFLLHGAPPDDVLLDAAAAGRFDTADGIEEAAREMLEAPETIANLTNFAEQWLRLAELEDVAVDPTQAPLGGGDLRESMRLSVLALVEEVIVDGHGVDLLLTAGHVHADAAIAQLYGVTPPDQEWDATAVDENERAGLLTAPAILAMTSPTEKSEPIIRGKWMRDVLLCSSPPPPPPDVPELPSDDDVTSVRDALSQHRDDPACSGCHEFLDPLGFGLERYDALGRLREQDSFGADLSGRGTIVGLGEPIDFQGARELAEQIVALPAFDKCLTEHAFRFAMGRLPEMAETCAVEHVIDGYGAAGRDFRELIVALVRSDAFRYVQTPQQGS